MNGVFFYHLYSDNGCTSAGSGIPDYTGGKTGLFIPVWRRNSDFIGSIGNGKIGKNEGCGDLDSGIRDIRRYI